MTDLLTQLVDAPGRLQRYMDGCACGRADKAAVLAIKKELEEKDSAIERLEEEIRRRDREKDNLIHMQKDLQAQIQEIRRVLESQASEVAKNGSFKGGSEGGSKGGSMDLDEERVGLNEVSAAILMQKRVRGISSRKLAEKEKKKEEATQKMQKIARGRSTRKMMAQKKADGSIMELPGAKRVYGAAAVPPQPQRPVAAGRVVASASKPAPSFAPAQQFLRGSYDEPGRGANGYGIASGSGLDAGEDESVDSDYDNDEDAFYDLGLELLSGRLKVAKVYGQEEPPAAEDELEWETRYFVLYDTRKMCHFDGMQNGEPVGDRGLIDLENIQSVEKVLGVPTFVMKGYKKVYLFKLEPHDEVMMRTWIGAISVELSSQ